MFDLAFNLKKESEAIRNAVEESIENDYVTEDLNRLNPKTTSGVGDWIEDFLLKN
jgi:3-isopropylmalate dehydrogenase